MNKIPSNPAWCSYCRLADRRCGAHSPGQDGAPQPYNGSDVYEPSGWVTSVVGRYYQSMGRVYVCDGYDPRHGFWMTSVDRLESRSTNVSERAIDRTFHRLELPTISDWKDSSAHLRVGRDYGTGRLRERKWLASDDVDVPGCWLYRVDCYPLFGDIFNAHRNENGELWVRHTEICWHPGE